eukprot:TRINITY_DN7783_c0_g1_i1.p2 TRINITY_DN7783_c0_g1~~TRINITY_DN7783_c0_g1_i1.p2  ORF type:complete len:251 (+),score=82.33 TRINITY_DN7783_c0_g1_i1:101-853(+)
MGRDRKRRKVDVPPVPDGVGGKAFGDAVRVSERLRSRVLYANPVCLLCTRGRGEGARANVMTISWLTCINNNGVFFMSMNEHRASAGNVYDAEGDAYFADAEFVLNVPVQGAEALLRRVGGETGKEVDKFGTLGLKRTAPGAWESPATCDGDLALDHPLVVAHLACRVLEGRRGHGHHLLTCEVQDAYVRARYWAGDTFRPTDPALPPYLTFFGAGVFGGAAPGLLPGAPQPGAAGEPVPAAEAAGEPSS